MSVRVVIGDTDTSIINNSTGYLGQFPVIQSSILVGDIYTNGKARLHIGEPYKGYTIDAEYANGVINGNVMIYNAENIIQANLSVKNGLREGKCLEYDKEGNLHLMAYYHLDKMEGFARLYISGVFVKMYKCENDEFIYEYTTEKPGLIREVDSKTKKTIALSHMNENYNRNGVCHIFVDDKIHDITIYENGEPKRCLRLFEGNEMTEFNDNEEMIYKGEYLDSIELGYPRNGTGKTYNKGSLIYYGNFIKGIRQGNGTYYRNGVKRFEGQWVRNYPNGYGKFYNEVGVLLYEGRWEYGYLKIDKGWIDFLNGELVAKDKTELKDWVSRGGPILSVLSMKNLFNFKAKK